MRTKENYDGIKGKLKFIKTVISWTLLIFLVIIALFLAYYLISSKVAKSKGENYAPTVALYNVLTQSMEPNIKPQDVVLTVKVKNPEDIKIGDIITFYSTSALTKGMTITHRVIEVVTTEQGIGYKTKGDNNTAPDSAPAEFDNVIGKVIIKIPQLGRIQSLLASRGGWLLIIVFPALFIIISDIFKLFHLTDIKKKATKIEKIEDEKKEKQELAEELRKKELKKRLNLRNENEPDPIPVKKTTRIVVGSSNLNIINKEIIENSLPKKARKKREKKAKNK